MRWFPCNYARFKWTTPARHTFSLPGPLLLLAYPSTSTSTSTAYFYCLHTTAFKPLICSTATHFLGACQFFQGLLRLICDSDYCPSKLLPFIACIYTGAFSSGFSLSRGGTVWALPDMISVLCGFEFGTV